MDRMFWKMLASGVAAGAGYFLYRSLQRVETQASMAEASSGMAGATSTGPKPDLAPNAEAPVSTTPIDPSGLTH